jgi:hypothetical protein
MPPTVANMSNLANSLKRIYPQAFFDAAQDHFTPTMDELDECPDKMPEGVALYFPFYLNTPHNERSGSEGQFVGGTTYVRNEIQGSVQAVEFVNNIALTEFLKNAATANGGFNGGEMKRQVKEATEDHTKNIERMVNISHGTSRVAVVEAGTVGSALFVAKNDEGVSNLMDGDIIDIYNLDAAGAIQYADVKILGINPTTREVTTDTSMTLSANWSAYKRDAYGVAINGFQGLIDDGTFADLIHGQSRSASGQSKLKSQVVNMGSPGTPAEILQEDVIDLLDLIHRLGGEVDKLAGNVGVLKPLFLSQQGNFRYSVEGGKEKKLKFGYNEAEWLFNYYRGDIRVRRGENLPNRTLYAYSLKKAFWRHTLKKLGWLEGTNGILHLTPGDGGFYTSWTGILIQQFQISCRMPAWNGVLRNGKDKLAGDV